MENFFKTAQLSGISTNINLTLPSRRTVPLLLTTMDGNKCILQLRGLPPFLSPKYDLKKHPNYKHTAEADRRNAFDPATLISTKLEINPGDLFIVYEADAPDEKPADEDILNYDDLDDPDAYA